MSRASTDKQREALKIAFGQAVENVGGGVIAAMLTRVKPAALSTCAAPHEEERHAALDVAFDLDKAVVDAGGEPLVGRAYMALLGYDIVPGETRATGAKLSLTDLRNLMREEHEFESDIIESLEDGKISASEKTRLKKDMQRMRQVIALIEAKVDAA